MPRLSPLKKRRQIKMMKHRNSLKHTAGRFMRYNVQWLVKTNGSSHKQVAATQRIQAFGDMSDFERDMGFGGVSPRDA